MKTFISKEQIETRLEELALQINKDCKDQELVVLCVLNGSFIFAADLVRRLKGSVFCDFIKLSSYSGTESSGQVKMTLEPQIDLKNKHVLVIEDILETGLTLKFLLEKLKEKAPASVKVCSLLWKSSEQTCDVSLDYYGFEIENKFVVGYGLDFDQRYRHLPDICIYEGE